MTRDAYLEIGLRWKTAENGHGVFDVNLDFDDPADTGDRRDYGEVPVKIDPSKLAQLVAKDDEYGNELRGRLFRSRKVADFFRRARHIGERGGIPVHLRLLVDPDAPPPFHAVRWESLRDPDDGKRIAVTRNMLFSRFLTSDNWDVVSPPPKHDLKALVVIANPSDLGDYGDDEPLTEIDVEDERKRACEALRRMEVVELSGEDRRPTLANVLAELEGGIDVLYLVCHGVMTDDGKAKLYLEDVDGSAKPADGKELIDGLAGLTRRPTLAVLCSCASAGAGDEDLLSDGSPLAALGPRLAQVGVPAVVAMQGAISMTSAKDFMTRFFEELDDDGAVDRAMAVARYAIENREDWWVPVLFSRLKRGRTYYLPEFGKREDTWRALTGRIQGRTCTPVIGPGLADGLVGSRKAIARQWAARWQMPLVHANRSDLATVAQYLRVRMAPDQPAEELRSYLVTLLRERYAKERESGELPEELFAGDKADELVREVARRRRAANGDGPEPYSVAASLRAPVYVTTNWSNLLEDAIEDAGRTPVSHYFDWASQIDEPCELDGDPDAPLVYHVFGRLSAPKSLVLSQDDYFAWLQAWINKKDTPVLPTAVREALTTQTLLFLGYELDDWDFRVLFQGIKAFGGNVRMGDSPHVGVQLNPEMQSIEPESAQEYLEEYFGVDNVTIYWGRLEKFLGQLRQRLEEAE
jgi:SIR2-like domain/CHAT domain